MELCSVLKAITKVFSMKLVNQNRWRQKKFQFIKSI